MQGIVEKIAKLFVPFFKENKSLVAITNEIKEAFDTSLLELWNKVKPVFIEEFEESEDKLSKHSENEGTVKFVLEKALSKNQELLKEIQGLLEDKKEQISHSEQIINSKNVIFKSNFNAGGDINIGDIIN